MNEFGIAGWHYSQPILRERSMSLLQLPGVVRGLELDILELCSTFFENQTAKYLLDVRTAIDDAGLRIPNIAVDGPDISQTDPVSRTVHLETIKQWFHVAHAVGSESIRVNSGGSPDASEDDLARIAGSYRELPEYGEREGIAVLIENHGGASTRPRNIAWLLESVNSPWFGACPDSGNFPDGTWEEGIAAMAPYARSTHIKVASYADDGWQEAPGSDGVDRSNNLRLFLAKLKETAYEGPFCIEQGIADVPLDESARGAVAYVRQLLATI